jgi:hypothetical protein|tara:strand:+ start:25324 stop:25521 length:198 start_codon:yes stop_codon:yes gene_type:complete
MAVEKAVSAADSFMVDGIQSVAIHNGVARIVFMRLDTNGKPLPTVELNVPMNQMSSITQALGKVK